MEANKYRTDCALKDTRLCDFAGCDGCDFCVFKNGVDKHNDPEKMAANWEVTLSYLPKDIDELHDTDTCVFCGKNHADGYAELSLGHPEPEYKKGIILGLGKKVRTAVGSLADIPIAVCAECRRKMRMKDIIQLGGGTLVAAIAVAVMLIPGIEQALTGIGWAMPLAVFAGILAVGWSAVYIIGDQYQRKLAEKIHANPLEIPQIADAVARGWFPVPDAKKGFPRVNFVKHMPRKNFRYFKKDADGRQEDSEE